MGVILFGILSHLFCFLVIYVDAIPVDKNSQSLHVLPYIAMRSDGSTVCKDFEAKQWNSGFHGCFIGKKYADGGRNLNYIVDRILDHGEACMETSSLECRPDFQGFITLMNKTITQMKDYAEMYLEEIYKGRENIHDLECMEKVLSIKTYEDCFRDIVPQAYSLSNEHIQKVVQKGIFCANDGNSGCSKEAKTSLNRIVRILLQVEHPSVEEFEDEIKPTEAPATWMWYDYLAYPFVEAWKWISGLFG